MSDNASARSDIPAKWPLATRAARYAAVMFGVTAGPAVLKLLLHRILAAPRDHRLLGPFILATILGFFWFALSFLLLRRASSNDSHKQQHPSPSNAKDVLKTVTRALVVACVLSISAWVGLYLNDEILESRSLPWIEPMITLQHYGFITVNKMFPCQMEGSDIGCEAYKWIPTFLAANSLAYFPFALVTLYSFHRWDAVRKTTRAAACLFARWSLLVAGTGLVVLQFMHGLSLDTHDSLYPHPGIGHWHLGTWELTNDVTGTLITIAGLSLPFYLYRMIRRGQGLDETRITLTEATSLSATILIALMLGDVY